MKLPRSGFATRERHRLVTESNRSHHRSPDHSFRISDYQLFLLPIHEWNLTNETVPVNQPSERLYFPQLFPTECTDNLIRRSKNPLKCPTAFCTPLLRGVLLFWPSTGEASQPACSGLTRLQLEFAQGGELCSNVSGNAHLVAHRILEKLPQNHDR